MWHHYLATANRHHQSTLNLPQEHIKFSNLILDTQTLQSFSKEFEKKITKMRSV